MEIILHLGAQRSATTTFQHYMRQNAEPLAGMGIGFWGPERLRRGGLFGGLYAGPSAEVPDTAVFAARARLAPALDRAAAQGVRTLVISDENMIGSVRGNMRHRCLYPEAGLRLNGFVRALGRPVSKALLGIRPLGAYWSSALAYGVWRGADVPEPETLAKIAGRRRSWRDVALEIADVCGSAEVELQRFEAFAGAPGARLAAATGCAEEALPAAQPSQLNAAPSLERLRRCLAKRGCDTAKLPQGKGRWEPFQRAEQAMLDELYADDIFWCAAGGGGVAKLTERKGPRQAGTHLPQAARRGRYDDQARRLGRAG